MCCLPSVSFRTCNEPRVLHLHVVDIVYVSVSTLFACPCVNTYEILTLL